MDRMNNSGFRLLLLLRRRLRFGVLLFMLQPCIDVHQLRLFVPIGLYLRGLQDVEARRIRIAHAVRPHGEESHLLLGWRWLLRFGVLLRRLLLQVRVWI